MLATPLVASVSKREPEFTHTPTVAVSAPGIVSVATRRPLGSVVTYAFHRARRAFHQSRSNTGMECNQRSRTTHRARVPTNLGLWQCGQYRREVAVSRDRRCVAQEGRLRCDQGAKAAGCRRSRLLQLGLQAQQTGEGPHLGRRAAEMHKADGCKERLDVKQVWMACKSGSC